VDTLPSSSLNSSSLNSSRIMEDMEILVMEVRRLFPFFFFFFFPLIFPNSSPFELGRAAYDNSGYAQPPPPAVVSAQAPQYDRGYGRADSFSAAVPAPASQVRDYEGGVDAYSSRGAAVPGYGAGAAPVSVQGQYGGGGGAGGGGRYGGGGGGGGGGAPSYSAPRATPPSSSSSSSSSYYQGDPSQSQYSASSVPSQTGGGGGGRYQQQQGPPQKTGVAGGYGDQYASAPSSSSGYGGAPSSSYAGGAVRAPANTATSEYPPSGRYGAGGAGVGASQQGAYREPAASSYSAPLQGTPSSQYASSSGYRSNTGGSGSGAGGGGYSQGGSTGYVQNSSGYSQGGSGGGGYPQGSSAAYSQTVPSGYADDSYSKPSQAPSRQGEYYAGGDSYGVDLAPSISGAPQNSGVSGGGGYYSGAGAGDVGGGNGGRGSGYAMPAGSDGTGGGYPAGGGGAGYRGGPVNSQGLNSAGAPAGSLPRQGYSSGNGVGGADYGASGNGYDARLPLQGRTPASSSSAVGYRGDSYDQAGPPPQKNPEARFGNKTLVSPQYAQQRQLHQRDSQAPIYPAGAGDGRDRNIDRPRERHPSDRPRRDQGFPSLSHPPPSLSLSFSLLLLTVWLMILYI